MFTLDGIRKFHGWTHACLSLLLDHLASIPATDYGKVLPAVGFSTLRAMKLRSFAMWSDSGERLPYNPEWAVEPSDNTHNATSPVPSFGSHSPLGSGEWIAPWNARWSVPNR